MTLIKNIAGLACILLGGLWVLQGANILGGSPMSGHSQWLVIGVVVTLAGFGVLYWANLRTGDPG